MSPRPPAKILSDWLPEHAALLVSAREAIATSRPEITLTHTPHNTHTARPSDKAVILAALTVAATCRCGGKHEEKALDFAIEVSNEALALAEAQAAAANPLAALRAAAGLSQAEAADAVGMTRGAWANAEKAAKATPKMVERARKALVGKVVDA